MIALMIALVWGFAEATLFFLVPDIFFTYLALFDPGLAYESSLFALVGALVGGGIMYHWGKKNFKSAAGVLETLPAISKELIQKEHRHLKEKGLWAVLLGPLKGVPYKIYAICAPSSEIPFSSFLLISIPARLTRFILSILIVDGVFHELLSDLSLLTQIGILSGFWLIFYTVYFLKMRNLSQ